jgi:hypothetical protein
MPGSENTQAATLSNEQSTLEINALPKPPVPTATGDERITILKHDLSLTDPVVEYPTPAGIELAIRNVSGRDIATTTFEATFFDLEGQVVSTVKHNEVEFKPETSRAIRIDCSLPHYESDKVKSYAVRVVKTTTTDVESVQLRRHELRTTEDGEEYAWGIVKNLSETKADAAVIWTFSNPKKENIGTRVVVLKDIEPNTIRQYEFKFKPPEGETVRNYSITVGQIAEQPASVSAPARASHDHC